MRSQKEEKESRANVGNGGEKITDPVGLIGPGDGPGEK